ncbi:hypothetical protein EC991_006410 [Linnemannia zychae]|nr:hypothetical protein EC991_006410 [Linnemannia zychae]
MSPHVDTTPVHSQAFRSVHKSLPPSLTSAPLNSINVIYIDSHTDPETHENFTLWEDVEHAYDGAQCVRDKARVLTFMRGPDFRLLEPRRIRVMPGVVLDVVVGEELRPPQQPPSRILRNPEYGHIKARVNLEHINQPVTPTSSFHTSQAFTTRDRHNGGMVNNASLKGQTGVTVTQVCDVVQGHDVSSFTDLRQTMNRASQGNADDQVALGDQYREGRKVCRDYIEAMHWYLMAAEQDHMQAQFMVGVLYFQREPFERLICLNRGDGHGDSVQVDKSIPFDDFKALEWFLKAASQGLADAQFGVVAAMLAVHDTPDRETIDTILEWCQMASDQDHGPAQTYTGLFYHIGLGVPRNGRRAYKWYLKAVGRTGGFAEILLGYLNEEGRGIPKSESTAFEWYLKSADQGYSDGQFKVAERYERGYGVHVNREKAIEWYTKAVNNDHPPAKIALERLTGE